MRCSPSETGAQLGEQSRQSLLLSRFVIFETQLFWRNMYAHARQTHTAHAQIRIMDFPCGFFLIFQVKTMGKNNKMK